MPNAWEEKRKQFVTIAIQEKKNSLQRPKRWIFDIGNMKHGACCYVYVFVQRTAGDLSVRYEIAIREEVSVLNLWMERNHFEKKFPAESFFSLSSITEFKDESFLLCARCWRWACDRVFNQVKVLIAEWS